MEEGYDPSSIMTIYDENRIWRRLYHPYVKPGYILSSDGYITHIDDDRVYTASYHSTNGHDYAEFFDRFNVKRLFPIDEMLGMAFVEIPEELNDKAIAIQHINGDDRDSSISNLRWIENVEQWKLLSFKGIRENWYEVSSLGRVRLYKTKAIMCTAIDKDGYTVISLQGDTNRYYGIHRLVSWAFLPDSFRYDLPVNHINGIKGDNQPKNLENVTARQNNIHARDMGLCEGVKGDKNYFTKYDSSIIETLCKLIVENDYNLKKTYLCALKEIPNVPESLIKHILYGESWVDISSKYFDKHIISKWRNSPEDHPEIEVNRDAFKK